MSAPPPGRPASSSSTGYEDGFGRRALIFDRADGCTFERLSLRPEFGIFETALRDRAARLAAWSHDRVALPRRVHREQAGGPLLVDTPVPQGERLIDLLDAPAEARTDQALSGVDLAIGFLLDVMPTLDALHREAGIVHGAIAPGRLLLTRTGHIVLLDPLYSEVVERLAWSRARLWRGLGLAMPGGQSTARLTAGLDVSQAVLTALMLLLGRPLRGREQPDDLEAACAEAVEVAEIVVGGAFAGAFGQFLRRALPLQTAEGFATAAEAGRELSDVTGTAVDAAACRAALIALAGSLAQVPARTGQPEAPEAPEAPVAERKSPPAAGEAPPPAPALDLRIEIPEAPPPIEAPPQVDAPQVEEAPLEAVPPQVEGPPQVDVAPPGDAAPQVEAPPQDAAPPQGAAPPADALRDGSAAPEPEPAPAAMAPAAVETAAAPPPEAPALAAEEPGPVAEPPAPPAAPPAPSKRRKRGRRGSDALRSATPPPKPPPPAAPAPAPVREPARPAPIAATPPPPPQPVFPAGGYDASQAAAPSPYSGMGDSWAPPQPAAPQAPAAPRPGVIAVKGAPLRVKEKPPARSAPRTPPPDEPFMPLPHDRGIGRRGTPASRGGFPWKIAAAVLVIVAGAAAGRTYLSDRVDAPLPSPAVAAAAPVTGSLVLSSTPDGARVLLDGKPAGETPLTLDGVAPGRRVVTIISSAGTVRRTVRVEAGQAATLEVQVFSGWLAVDAPIVLEVEQGGRVIGSTQQNRLLLPPGRHTVTLSNADLGYRAGHTVNIEPGEEHRLSVVPSTPVNLNASPWAEVWIDGRRVGETPMAGVSIPLGTRDIIFRHPDFADRRLTPTIKVGDPVAISIDFARPQ